MITLCFRFYVYAPFCDNDNDADNDDDCDNDDDASEIYDDEEKQAVFQQSMKKGGAINDFN